MGKVDLDDPKDYGSIVRNNLMKRPNYSPYCGNSHMARLVWDGEQFACPCGYRTEFTEDFVSQYVERWRV
jgi:hypothetical protein